MLAFHICLKNFNPSPPPFCLKNFDFTCMLVQTFADSNGNPFTNKPIRTVEHYKKKRIKPAISSMVVVVMRTISTKPDKSINFKTRRKSRVSTERKIKLPPRRNPWRWFNESAMSIAPIHKAKENEHKYTWSSVDFLTPRSSNNQAAITPEFCLSPPKEPKAWHQPPHPALWGLSNISSNTFFITSNL